MIKNLKVKKGQAYLLTDRLYRRYFSNIDVSEGYLLLSEESVYFTDARYFTAVQEKLKDSQIKCLLYEGDFSIKAELERQNVKNLYLDYQTTTLFESKRYKQFNVKLKDGTKALKRCREIKSEEEIASIKSACNVIESVLADALSIIKVGVTEEEIADFIKEQVKLRGAQDVSFETIVAFGEHSAVPHHETSKTKLKANECVLIDAGCVVNGYCSDITRTFFYGKPTKKFIDCYNAVLKANLLALEFVKTGELLSQADKVARQYLESQNLGKYFTHSLGHGVGLAIHEEPRLSKNAVGVFKNNVVFTIEPGVYIDGEFGIRIEDTVIVKNKTAQRLFNDDKNLVIIN